MQTSSFADSFLFESSVSIVHSLEFKKAFKCIVEINNNSICLYRVENFAMIFNESIRVWFEVDHCSLQSYYRWSLKLSAMLQFYKVHNEQTTKQINSQNKFIKKNWRKKENFTDCLRKKKNRHAEL